MTHPVVIYTRVSQDKSGREQSVGEQEAELRAAADEEGWRIDAVFSDNDRSASRYATKDRPGLIDLEQYLRNSPVEVLAIWEASRLARSMSVAIYFRDLCRMHGIKVWYGEKLYDMENADDQKHFTDDMADAEHESAKSSKRVQRSVRYRAARGLPHGKPQFGYTRIYGPNRELVEVTEHAEQADLLRAMATRVLGGESSYGIARDLTSRGIPGPSGGVWHPTNVTRLLKNPSYAGRRVLNGEVVGDGIWPRIFDADTWQRLQAILGDPARISRKEGAVEHLLSGLMLCGVCGGKVGTSKQNAGHASIDQKRQAYRAYFCMGKPPTHENPKPRRFCTARKMEPTDLFVAGVVIEKLSKPDALAVFAAASDDPDLAGVSAQIEILQARLESFYDAAAKGDLTPAALARIEGQVLHEIERAEAKRRNLVTPSVLRNIDLARIEDKWESWPLRTKRAIIRELFVVTMLPVAKTRTRPRQFDPTSVDVQLLRR